MKKDKVEDKKPFYQDAQPKGDNRKLDNDTLNELRRMLCFILESLGTYLISALSKLRQMEYFLVEDSQ